MLIKHRSFSSHDLHWACASFQPITFGLGFGIVEHNFAHNRTVERHVMIALQEMHTGNSFLIFSDGVVEVSYDGPIAVVEFIVSLVHALSKMYKASS